MNPAAFKTCTTSRGFCYRYLRLPAQDLSLPTLIFLHGFPTTSAIWKLQAHFFRAQGFGLLIPDMLGFGGSSKPTDPEAYKPSLICGDIIDIMDEEHVDQAIAIGHDLGSKIVSRLANLHETRFRGYAFLAVPYSAPRPKYTIDYTLHATKKMCGYELCGHTRFFAEDSAPTLIETHLESFYSAMFPDDPKMWVTHVAPTDALKGWLEVGRTTSIPSYLTAQDKQLWIEGFLQDGFEAPLCWYKAMVSGMNATDDNSIPLEKYIIKQPVFFGAARHDYISRSVLGIATTNHSCTNALIREFNAGHWLMLSNPVEVNRALHSWIMDIV